MTPVSATVPVLVVAGYLGAGKTTLINELLSQTQQKIAVVVNDFGSVNIDEALIASKNSDTIELSNGCVCCAIGSTLADTMLAISDRDIQPDAVVIEASGVALPNAVAANAYITGFHLAGIVVLVDAVNAETTARNHLVASTFTRQINAANLIAVSKTDIASATARAECDALLKNVSVPIIRTEELSLDELLSPVVPLLSSDANDQHNNFRSETILDLSPQTRDELLAFCTSLPANAVRAKGIVNVGNEYVLVQRVGTHTSLTTTSLPPTGIVVIYAD